MHRYCSDVLIHIHQDLADTAIHEIEYDIGCVRGVYSACVSARARHLMLIDYDPEDVHACDLLEMVRGRGLEAELVGL